MSPRPELLPGASWVTREGEVLPVPGFHEAWIEAHRDLVGEAKNVCEVILAKGWLSVALFGGGYVEVMIASREDEDARGLLLGLLSGREWKKALVIAMDGEGYAMLAPEDLADGAALEAALRRGI